MEDYSINNSSIHKSVNASKGTADHEEESGWTAYFEDLSNNDHDHYSSTFSCSSSLISDAATTGGACWKSSQGHNYNNDHVLACSSAANCSGYSPKIPKKLRFKKTRTKEICQEDDSLEDTASSPVNSPKVSDLKSNEMMGNPRKREDEIHSFLGKEPASSENYSNIQIEEEEEEEEEEEAENRRKNFDHGMKKNDCTELNKRGLCLVPLSMLVNYLG